MMVIDTGCLFFRRLGLDVLFFFSDVLGLLILPIIKYLRPYGFVDMV